jgi:hypothetical protein
MENFEPIAPIVEDDVRSLFRGSIRPSAENGLSVERFPANIIPRMSETPKEGNIRRQEAIQEVEEMRKKIAEKREELKQIRDRFRKALKNLEESGDKPPRKT